MRVHLLIMAVLIHLNAIATHAQSSTTGSVSGAVNTSDGKNTGGARVRAVNLKSGNPVSSRTDSEGRFRIYQLQPGEYKIEVHKTGYPEDEEPNFPVRFGTDNTIYGIPPFTLGLASIAGVVEDSSGKPIEGAEVVAADGSGKRQGLASKTRYDGSFTLRYLPAGRFVLSITKQEYEVNVVVFQITLDQHTNLLPPRVKLPRPIQLIPISTVPPTRLLTRGQLKESGETGGDRVVAGASLNEWSQGRLFQDSLTDSLILRGHHPVGRGLADSPSISGPLLLVQNISVLLQGKVTDESDNPLANVTVVASINGESKIYATLTDLNGQYTIPNVAIGIYKITASLQGYTEGDIPALKIDLSLNPMTAPPIKIARIPIPDQPPPASSWQAEKVINVSGIELVKPVRAGSFNEQQLAAFPLGGNTDMRTFDELAFLVPGVSPPPYTPGVRGPAVGFSVGTTGRFSVNGARARSNNFSVDGSDNNDPDVGVRRQGFITMVPQSIESIEEFQILTLLWDSELGRNLGSQVNLVSAYGGNDFHMQIYFFFTDRRLNARNFFDYAGEASGGESPFTRTQQGAVVGGPILNDRTHLFFSFESVGVNSAAEQHFSSPESGKGSVFGSRVLGVLDPLFQNDPNIFFRGKGAAPLGRNILSLYPKPNNPIGPYGINTYTEILPASGSGTVFSTKLTHRLAESNVFDARFNFTDDNKQLPSVNRAIRSTVLAKSRTENLSLIYNGKLSARIFNQARFSYGRSRIEFEEYPGNPLTFSRSSDAVLQDREGNLITTKSETGPIGELVIEPFSPVGVDTSVFPQKRVDNTFQYADTLSTTKADHSIKFGFDIRRVQLNSRQEKGYRPRLVFANAEVILGNVDLSLNNDPADPAPFEPRPGGRSFISGLELARIGLPSSIFQTITLGPPDPTIGLRFTELSFFFNDNWRVRPNVSLDYGVRYEYNSVPREDNGRIEQALRLENFPKPGSSRFDSRSRSQALSSARQAYAGIIGGRTRIYNPDYNNFGPHVGFAWAPDLISRKIRTSMRAGYGIYFDTILGAVVSQSRNIFPNEIPLNVDPILGGFDVLNLSNPVILRVFAEGGARSVPLIAPGTLNQLGGSSSDAAALIGDLFLRNKQGGGLAFTLPSQILPTPYAQHWHLTIECELPNDVFLSGAYVGTKGTKLVRLTTPNLGPNITLSIPVAVAFIARGGNDTDPSPLTDLGLPPILVIPKKADSRRLERPIPELGAYQILENSASSIYHSFQAEVRKRYSKGYTLTAAYTWSHAIDDVSDILPIAGAPALPQDSFNHRTERASSNFDVRHIVAISLAWDLPFRFTSSRMKALLLNNWQVASILRAHTGQPFTLNVPVDANLDGNLSDRPSTVEGLNFFSGHGPRRIGIMEGRGITDFFVPGLNGLVGRNTVRGDNYINWDLALNRSIQVGNKAKLGFRTEIFNVLNRANFGLPIRTIGAPGFGSSVETVNPARIIQFALKLAF